MRHVPQKIAVLSGNALKLIAALSMLIDHIGVILFPDVILLRVLGRIAFPIFAFMIAEGCRYTRHRVRYFCTLLGLGVACQLGLWAYDGAAKLNVLLTFALSVLLVYALEALRQAVAQESPRVGALVLGFLPLCLVLSGAIVLTLFVPIEYGVAGAMLPMFAAATHPVKEDENTRFRTPLAAVLLTGVGMLVLSVCMGGVQWFCLLALPLLLLYSGKRGKWRMKYFFYIFYPAHILILQGLALLLG